jgi:CRP/FNR family transcriptional regulator, cyclic AMP receptor protein
VRGISALMSFTSIIFHEIALVFSPALFYIGTIDESILLASGASFKQVAKGEQIFSEGSYCSFYHQLVSGSVRWVNIDDDGRTYVQAFIEPGECFGEMPLFDNGPYASSAFAEKDSLILRLKKEHFLQLMAENSQLLMELTRILAQRLRSKFFILKCIANPSPEIRLVRLLENLKFEGRHINAVSNLLLLTRQQLADLSGLRVETVIRTIRHMHDEGILLVQDRKIYLQ